MAMARFCAVFKISIALLISFFSPLLLLFRDGSLYADDEVPRPVRLKTRGWWNDGGSAVFGDDGGAGIFFARAELVAGIDFGFEFLGVEEDCGVGRGNSAEPCSA